MNISSATKSNNSANKNNHSYIVVFKFEWLETCTAATVIVHWDIWGTTSDHIDCSPCADWRWGWDKSTVRTVRRWKMWNSKIYLSVRLSDKVKAIFGSTNLRLGSTSNEWLFEKTNCTLWTPDVFGDSFLSFKVRCEKPERVKIYKGTTCCLNYNILCCVDPSPTAMDKTLKTKNLWPRH